MKRTNTARTDDLRPEYDLATLLKGSARGKYAVRYRRGTNIVRLDPDVSAVFKNEAAVNEALRSVLQLRSSVSVGARTK